MSGALFSRAKTWIAEILNYTDLNTEFDNVLNNMYPEMFDDGSATEAQMQAVTDPYPASVASLPTSLQGELQRLRYLIAQITGNTYWYQDPETTIAILNSMVPWMIDIDVFMAPGAQTNWATNTQSEAENIFAGYNISSGDQNAEISWPVVLSAGTWSLSVMHLIGSDKGIYTPYLDATALDTFDGYAASPSYNAVSNITSITVATSGKKTLKLKMETKHASSSNYYGAIQKVRLIRTA